MSKHHTIYGVERQDWDLINRRIAENLRFHSRTEEFLSYLPLSYNPHCGSLDDGYVLVADLTADMGLKTKAQLWKYLRSAEESYGLNFEVRHKNTHRAEIRLPLKYADRVRGLLTRSLTQSACRVLSDCCDAAQ